MSIGDYQNTIQPSYDSVIDRLETGGYAPKKSGDGHLARCPGHDDQNPSLSINRKDDGGALFKCFSNGCSYQSILEALGLWTTVERKEKDVPYHIVKRVKLHSPAFIDDRNNLIVPLKPSGQISIWSNSKKLVSKGTKTNEAVFFFSGDDVQIKQALSFCVATGYSTSASIYESTGCITSMVVSDDNVAAIVKKLRSEYPHTELTICADYDAREKFTSLALQYNCRLCHAPLVNGNPKSDFNDLMIAQGKSVVCEIIGDAKFVTADSVKESKPENRQYGITGADLLLKKFDALNWVIPDILPDVGAYLLAGKQKMGKSWFSLALALAYTQGGKFLNRDVPKGKVVYLGLEDSQRRMQSRILTLQPDVDRDPTLLSNIRFFHGDDNVPRLDNGFFDFVDPYLDGVRFMVIDILQKIRPMKGSGNVYQDDYNALGAIQTFANERNMCILILHHTRKADADDVFDTLNGSGGVGGAVDGALIIARKRGEGAAILSTTGREIPELEHGLTFKDGVWTYAGSAAEVRATGEQNEVFSHIAEAGSEGATVAELCETLGKNEPAIRKLLRKLGESGRIRKRDTKPAPHYAVCDGPLSGGYSPNVTPP